MEKVRKADVMAKWTPDKVEEACGVKEARCSRSPDAAENSPGTIVWCMGQTQHTIGNAMVRASCILQLALGNVGKSGGGTNIFRGHDNVQGATDVGPNPDSLPGYYGIAEGSWKHFAKAWGVDFEWIKKQLRVAGDDDQAGHHGVALDRRRAGEERPDRPGLQPARHLLLGPCAQLADARPGDEARHGQAGSAGRGRPLPVGHRRDGGHARQARGPESQPRGVPAAGGTQFETSGSARRRTARIQWREKVIEPLWDSRTDHMIMYQLAEKLGFGKELVKNYKMQKVKGWTSPCPKTSCAKSTAPSGPSATPARAPSG
jgi:formate dehydrogenase major subunit